MWWIPPLLLVLTTAFALLWVWRSAFTVGRDDPSGMIGQLGVAQENFTQEGIILVRGELWRATSLAGIVHKGDSVKVSEVRSGLILVVDKVS